MQQNMTVWAQNNHIFSRLRGKNTPMIRLWLKQTLWIVAGTFSEFSNPSGMLRSSESNSRAAGNTYQEGNFLTFLWCRISDVLLWSTEHTPTERRGHAWYLLINTSFAMHIIWFARAVAEASRTTKTYFWGECASSTAEVVYCSTWPPWCQSHLGSPPWTSLRNVVQVLWITPSNKKFLAAIPPCRLTGSILSHWLLRRYMAPVFWWREAGWNISTTQEVSNHCEMLEAVNKRAEDYVLEQTAVVKGCLGDGG